MKKTIKIFACSLLMILSLSSCEDYLTSEDFDAIDSETFISNVSNAQTAMNGVYSSFYMDWTWRGEIYYYLLFATNELEYRHASETYIPLKNFGYTPEAPWFLGFWRSHYLTVGRANDVMTKLEKLYNSSELTTSDQDLIDQMIGECHFLRGFAYFWLTRSFGDKLPSHPQYDPEGMGVPIVDEVINTKDQLIKSRNTLDECWKYIIEDWKKAYDKLPTSWNGTSVGGVNKVGAATKGAAAGYLGQAAMYYGDKTFPDGSEQTGYQRAKYWFEKCMEAGNYALVKDIYWNFDEAHENNSESIFEIQFDNKTPGYSGSYTWRLLGPEPSFWGTVNVSMDYVDKFAGGNNLTQELYDDMIANPRTYIGGLPNPQKAFPLVVEKAFSGVIGQDFSDRFAFFESYTGSWDALAEEINTELANQGVRRFDIKNDDKKWGTADSKYVSAITKASAKDDDPRMYASFYIPNRDSIRNIVNGEYAGYSTYTTSYYGYKKGIPNDATQWWSSMGLPYNDGHNSINQRIFRLADLYLQYAEACYFTGSTSTAIEYLNKVRRRAWGLDIDTPSEKDFTTGDFFEALVKEREKELCLEGQLHFDYLRWWDGPYGACTLYASRGFNPNKHHRLPIPLSERQAVGLSVLLQNENY